MGAVSEQSFISGGRPPVLRFAWRLYQSDDAFRGLVDFAIVGSVVLLFLDPWALQSARNLTDRAFSVFETLVSQRIERMPQGVAPEARTKSAQLPPPQQVAAGSSPADTPHDVNAPPTTAASPPAVKSTTGPPTRAASGPPLATQTPAVSPSNDERRAGLTTSPGESAPAAPKQIDVPMPLAAALKSPRLLSPQFLIEIDESAFRSSSSDDQQRLKKATADYRSMRINEMMEDLAHASSADANVLFLRALGLMRQISSNRYSLARHLLQTAVSGGQAQAAVILGILLASGPDGVEKDVSEGRKLIEVAAVAGDRMAQRAAGLGRINGEFGSLDPVTGATWLKRAAEAGDPQAMLHYAYLLSTGTGVETNGHAAENYARRAAEAGLSAAQETLGAWILDRYKSGLIADPTEGVRWLTQAYQLGFSTNALVQLGLFYVDEGRGEWRDRSKSFALFSQCIGYASANCQFAYAYHLQHGFGTPSDPAKSYTYYEVARVLGAPRAPERLQALDRMLSSDEKAKAVELAKSIRSELRAIPTQVIFQYAGNQPPSPWSARSGVSPSAPIRR
jgi:TPR repeat protein